MASGDKFYGRRGRNSVFKPPKEQTKDSVFINLKRYTVDTKTVTIDGITTHRDKPSTYKLSVTDYKTIVVTANFEVDEKDLSSYNLNPETNNRYSVGYNCNGMKTSKLTAHRF